MLICEAPPGNDISEKEKVKYFYNPNNTSVPQSYLEAVFNALYPEQKENNLKYTADKKQQKLNQ